MVIKRTIAHMRTRPYEERRAFAGAISVLVMGVLFVGWGFYFFTTRNAGSLTAYTASTAATVPTPTPPDGVQAVGGATAAQQFTTATSSEDLQAQIDAAMQALQRQEAAPTTTMTTVGP